MEITKWKPTNCLCRLCETYVKDLRFTLVNNNANKKPRVPSQRNKQYLTELKALISYETNVALSIMCSYLFILWF